MDSAIAEKEAALNQINSMKEHFEVIQPRRFRMFDRLLFTTEIIWNDSSTLIAFYCSLLTWHIYFSRRWKK